MAWLKSHEELPTHAKTRKAARLLGISIPQMVGHLHLLWWWTMNHAPSGDLSMASADDIADAALWQGDADAFISALETCSVTGGYGFLARTEDGLFVNDWDQHGGTILQSKKSNAQKQSRYRNNKRKNEQVTVTDNKRNGNVTKKTPSQIEKEKEKEIKDKTYPPYNPPLPFRGGDETDSPSAEISPNQGDGAPEVITPSGTGKKTKGKKAGKPLVYTDGFAEFWQSYPRSFNSRPCVRGDRSQHL